MDETIRQPAASARSRLPWMILLAWIIFWIVLSALAAPTVGGVDVFIFRDAGCNVAAGSGLTAASVPHAQTAAPQLFASYTPGAPLLFSIAARLFGCHPYVDVFYNLLFGALASFLLLLAFMRGVERPAARAWAALLIGAMLPTGMFTTDVDRPELPAFCLLVGLLLIWTSTKSNVGKTILIGLNGVVFLIHPFAGLAGLLLFAFLIAFAEEPSQQHRSSALRFVPFLSGSVLFAAICAVCAYVFWRIDHTAIQRFMTHAMGPRTGAGVVLDAHGGAGHPSFLTGYRYALHHVFNKGGLLLGIPIISMLISLLVLAGYSAARVVKPGERGRLWIQFIALAAILFAFPFLLFLNQPAYFALTRELMLVVLVLGGFLWSNRLRHSSAPLVLLVIAFLFTAPMLALSVLQGVETHASYREAEVQAARVHEDFVQAGIPKAHVLTDPEHFFLYKPYFSHLYDLDYLEAGEPTTQYQGLVLCYTASVAFSRGELPWPEDLHPNDWRLIDGNTSAVRITLLGKPIMRRNWTWSCDAYQRISQETNAEGGNRHQGISTVRR